MQMSKRVSGWLNAFVLTVFCAGLIGLAQPAPVFADGNEDVGHKTKTKTKVTPITRSKLSEQEKKRLITRLKRDLKRAEYRIEDNSGFIRNTDVELKRLESEIAGEHEQQVKDDKTRKALEKKRSKIVRDLRRNSKTLTRAEKDEMVRQANKLQGEIKLQENKIRSSKAKVKGLRRKQSRATITKGQYQKKVFDSQQQKKKITAELKKLK